MKKLRKVFSKRRYIVAVTILLLGIAITPLMAHLAYLERGYFAIGGEYGVIILAFLAIVVMLQVMKEKDNHENGGGKGAR